MSSPRATSSASPAFVAIAAALAASLVALAYFTPIAHDDWIALLRAHDDGAGAALLAARSPAEFVHQLLATSALAHVVLAPLIVGAFVIGATALVIGRVPDRRRAGDAIAMVVVLAAMILGCPRLGEACTHRPFVAYHVLGLAAALWLFVPVRSGGAMPRALALVLGVIAASSGRGVASIVVAGLALVLARAPAHRRWVGVALAGAALAAARVWIAPPALPSPHAGGTAGALALAFDSGQLLLWTILVTTGALVAARVRGAALPEPPPRELGALGWIALAGFALAALGAVPPGPDLLAWLPATALLAMCAARGVLLLADARATRVIGALALAVVAIALVSGVLALHTAAARADARDDALRASASASSHAIATAPPADPIAPTFWTTGEDLAAAPLRERVASSLYGARDLAIAPAFHGYEPSPADDFTATWTQPPPAPPRDWGRSPAEARRRFAAAVAGTHATGELDVDLPFPARAARPIVVAHADDGAVRAPAGRLLGRDTRGRRGVTVDRARLADVTDAWALAGGAADPAAPLGSVTRGGRAEPATCDRADAVCWFAAPTTDTYAIVVCDRARCDLVASAYLIP